MSQLRILFDLDGTLMETAPDLHQALNHCLTSIGRDEVSLLEVKHMVGQGARKLLEKGLNATGGMVSEEELDKLFDLFLEYYGDHLSDHSFAFPGVFDALKKLKSMNVEMGICTNKPYSLAKDISDDCGLSEYCTVLTGGDSFNFRKPDPRHLTETLKLFGTPTSHAIMVGDSINDIAAAKAAGIPSIAVTFGYTETPAEELGADIVIDHFDKLVSAVQELTSLVE